MKRKSLFVILILVVLIIALFLVLPRLFGNVSYQKGDKAKDVVVAQKKPEPKEPPSVPVIASLPPLDTAAYDKKMLTLANNPPDPIVYQTIKTISKDAKGKSITKITKVALDPQPVRTHLWPVKAVYPIAGALLPFNRIIAYYGNLYSKNMGVLGQYPEDEMLAKLDVEVKKWEAADPTTPVIPALHYIADVAQGSPCVDGKYRARMPDSEIQKVLVMAAKIHAIVFLDIQVGFSTVQSEVPYFEKYLKLPNVELGIDPEFSMKSGIRPGKIVGTMDATDVNFTANYLAKIVKDNNLAPKILVVHRYTQKMVTNYQDIKPLPEVQIVMDMDGWGVKAKKIGTYTHFIYPEPVQFTGFKLFYKNDVITPGTTMLTPLELLKLNPIPSYIQYQ